MPHIAKNSPGSMGAGADFKLDTKNFNSMCAMYDKQADVFYDLKQRVNSILDEVSEGWEGKGKKAFEKQAKNIRKNLADLMEIIVETRDVLIKAGENYTDVDSGIGKQMETDK